MRRTLVGGLIRHRRIKCGFRLVIFADGHQRHRLDHPQSGGEAPALSAATDLAAARKAHVHLVDTYWPVVSDRAGIDRRLSAAAEDVRRRGVGVTAHLIGGDPVDAVIDVAEQTDAALIVIDPRAASTVTPWRAYSLPARVCARAPCDVLIAR